MIFDNLPKGAGPRDAENGRAALGRGVWDTRRAIRVSGGEWRVASSRRTVASGETIVVSGP